MSNNFTAQLSLECPIKCRVIHESLFNVQDTNKTKNVIFLVKLQAPLAKQNTKANELSTSEEIRVQSTASQLYLNRKKSHYLIAEILPFFLIDEQSIGSNITVTVNQTVNYSSTVC
ncbi:hypothetical protein CDAR_549811 [Caerostris darwini]|uniref:Uncharacterized protein n=1 Tax=Caerostris darwini TaxID=1538125 RepID=A0AAV4NRW7_9ARAC|nr:hypothetical protein CDAR_549811 [Caerostris darwini]